MIRLATEKRARPESVVPMINVVFLLLVFFLMTAVLTPPDPFEVALPGAEAPLGETSEIMLVVGASGQLALGTARGEAVFSEVPAGLLKIRADASLDGAELARLVSRLRASGVTRVELVTRSR
jgi:biopolymer transport protein ExbD